MAQSQTLKDRIKKSKHLNFGKIPHTLDLPNLVETQKKSYEWFLQRDISPDKRQSQGLQAVFQETFPIESPNEDIVLEFVDYTLGEPKYDEQECRERDVTYAIPLRATIRLIGVETGEVREQTVFMGDVPVMTKNATFVINGAERVVVSQLHRSPGIFFFFDDTTRTYQARIIPYRGSWLEFEMDAKGILNARIDRKKKFPFTLLVKALGYGSNEEILRLFYDTEKIKLKKTGNDHVLGRRTIHDIVTENGEIVLEAGGLINIDRVETMLEAGITSVELILFHDNKDDSTVIASLDKENSDNSEIALKRLHSVLKPGEPNSVANAMAELNRLFFSTKSYDLGTVGRYKINKKFQFDDAKFQDRTLCKEDIIETLRHLLRLMAGVEGYYIDDIDHLGNRRIRSVGELLMNQMKIGFARMERVIKERMTIQDIDVITPQALISIKPITAVVNEFFGSSQLSQFMDQTNPLSELTHKRRLNALGPGGLSRERAGFEVRDVHYTHYGRMCPIETPEGPNIGLIVSMASYARINDYGFLESPYRVVKNGQVTEEIRYLTADEEDRYFVAQANAPVDETGKFINNLVACRNRGNYPYQRPLEIQYMDVAPMQIVSMSTSLIPFLEHDDANRALMGSNMQRQAVPLLVEEPPLVGTGIEDKSAYDSGVLVIAENSGTVQYVDAKKIIIGDGKQRQEYKLLKYKRSNQGTCYNQRPLVAPGQKIKKGDVIADGPATKDGRLALGKNVLAAFMPWEGYNFEDAILISERVVKEDVFSSIHIEEFEVEARETKLGREVITRDIPNLSEKAFSDLDENGVIRTGAHVKADDILVGKVTPKGETELTPEYKLLHSIFGEKAREVRDTSLRLPNGVEGIVIEVREFSRENGDELSPGVEQLVKVYVANKRKLSVGDKMAGRHGNKGVVARIMAEADMPYLEDGTPVDIVLNPLSVPSRMNLGQIFETELGWAAHRLGVSVSTPVLDGANHAEILEMKELAGIPVDSKVPLYDGRSGESFEGTVMVGMIYMLKLAHLVDDKIHARSTGPYSLVTQQPLGGKAQFGGQRLGEMEVWALEAYGAAHTLQEILTVKSDDMIGRARIYEAIVKGHNVTKPGVPESFNVLVQELRGLALDITIYDKDQGEIDIHEWDDGVGRKKRKIKFDSLTNEQ